MCGQIKVPRIASRLIAIRLAAHLMSGGVSARLMEFIGAAMKKKWKTRPVPLPEPSAKQLRAMWHLIKTPKDECWPWTGKTHTYYPYPNPINVADTGKKFAPARLMFSWFKYPIPPDFTIDHLCKNPICMNPDHMEPVTHGENARRAHKKRYCKRGHAQVPENRYAYKANGKRRSRCRLCIPLVNAEQRAKKQNVTPRRR